MTKKILVDLISALMLFAFVACDNSTPNAAVEGITITANGDYLVGQSFDPSDFTVTAIYSMALQELLLVM